MRPAGPVEDSVTTPARCAFKKVAVTPFTSVTAPFDTGTSTERSDEVTGAQPLVPASVGGTRSTTDTVWSRCRQKV
jgi:hypothetical protein